MGFVDRGGGRESKNSSLRASKKNPGCAASRAAAKQPHRGPSIPEPPKPLMENTKGNMFFDTSAALLSRQFDIDLNKVIERSKSTSNMCCGVVLWSADVEKQSALIKLTSEHIGFLYSVIGLHPDNVDRTHQRGFDIWTENIENLSKSSGCVGVLSGLNLTREIATHFAQEILLKSMMKIAVSCGRPLVLHAVERDDASMDRLVMLLDEWCENDRSSGNEDENDSEHEIQANTDKCSLPTNVVLHNAFLATNYRSNVLQKLTEMGVFIEVSAGELAVFSAAYTTFVGTKVDSDAKGSRKTTANLEELKIFTKALLPMSLIPGVDATESCVLVPKCSILFASDSPRSTPQTIEDDYLRTEKNEPSNMESVISAIELALTQGAMLLTNDKQLTEAKMKSIIHQHVAELVEESKRTAVKVFKIPAEEDSTPDPVHVTVFPSTDKKHVNPSECDGTEKSRMKCKGKKKKHLNKRSIDSAEESDANCLSDNENESLKKKSKTTNKKNKQSEDQSRQPAINGPKRDNLKRKDKSRRVGYSSDSEDALTLEKIHAALMAKADKDESSDSNKSQPPLPIVKKENRCDSKKSRGGKHVGFAGEEVKVNEVSALMKTESLFNDDGEREVTSGDEAITEETTLKQQDELNTIVVAQSDILLSLHRIPDGRPTLMYNCSKCRSTLFSSLELVDAQYGAAEVATICAVHGAGSFGKKDGRGDVAVKNPFYFLKPLSKTEEKEIQRLMPSKDGSGDKRAIYKKVPTVYSEEMLDLLPNEELFGVSYSITLGIVRRALPSTLRLCDRVGTLECTRCGQPKVGTVFLSEDVSEEERERRSLEGDGVSIICRITASKVDVFDEEYTIVSLQRRAQAEAGRALLEEEIRRQKLLEEEIAMKERKHQPKKNVKSNNKSNFTHFRNKNFAVGTTSRKQRELNHSSSDDDESTQVEVPSST